jgi:hypothetical protein
MIGCDPSHLIIGLPPSLPAVEGQGEREGLAQVIRIGGSEWIGRK